MCQHGLEKVLDILLFVTDFPLILTTLIHFAFLFVFYSASAYKMSSWHGKLLRYSAKCLSKYIQKDRAFSQMQDKFGVFRMTARRLTHMRVLFQQRNEGVVNKSNSLTPEAKQLLTARSSQEAGGESLERYHLPHHPVSNLQHHF